MWIKKITSKLYLYVIACFVLSAVVSLCFWYGAGIILQHIENVQYEKIAETQKQNFDSLAPKIQELIDKNGYSARDIAKMYRYDDNHDNKSYELFSIASNGKIYNGEDNSFLNTNKFFKDMYIYSINFSEGEGFIVINPITEESVSDFYESAVIVFSILIFIILTYFTIYKQLKYIETIDKEISYLAKGDLTHRIKVCGHNELSHLATSINTMSYLLNEKIEQEKLQDKKQRELITNISHDLRTPLTSVIGYLYILKDKKFGNEKEALSYLDKATSKSEYLHKLLNELFAYTKLTNGDVSYSPKQINLHTFALQYLEVQDINVELLSDENKLPIMTDIDWLHRIMDNLFDNIRKYADLDEPVRMTLKKKLTSVYLVLENKTKQDLEGKAEFIFDRMYVSKESRTDTSSGLGLAIVKESMTKMNGTAYAKYKNKILQIILKFNMET